MLKTALRAQNGASNGSARSNEVRQIGRLVRRGPQGGRKGVGTDKLVGVGRGVGIGCTARVMKPFFSFYYLINYHLLSEIASSWIALG